MRQPFSDRFLVHHHNGISRHTFRLDARSYPRHPGSIQTTRPVATETTLLHNHHIAELLAREAETKKPPASKALRRAARSAHLWPEEAVALIEADRPLTELASVGPYIADLIQRWIHDPPPIPKPPPIRDDFLTLAQARTILAADSSWFPAIKGDLQMHTTWSDGSGSIEEMAEAALERRYEYIAITDHSQGLKIAGGITPAQLRQQHTEIAAVNKKLKASGQNFRVLRSIELNLSPSGEGDMDKKSLAHLDLVLGCFHSALRKKEDQTDRYLAALRNPMIQILGHPRGRIYNYRLGLKADWARVFATAAELDKAVEIDAYPDRQDLNVTLLRKAKKAGCRISLGTDSHGPTQLRFMELAAAAALHAKIKPDRILNFLPANELIAWAQQPRPTYKS
jgi:histidinol phosphatase-like PHP family hydrolase